jgi:tetratricopeptide (TPR) repeat protein
MRTSNLYVLITIVITWWALVGCSTESPASNSREGIRPEAIQQAFGEAEGLFKQREDLDNLRAAIKKIGDVRDADNRNYQVEWTFAKYNYFLGRFSPNEDEAEKSFTLGRDAGRIASRIEPEKPDGHFWYAANLGELSKRSPITIGLRSVDDIKESMSRVLELQPDYQAASAYDALGQIELKTRLKGGDPQKAVEYLEKGLALAPDNSNIRVHLAEAYLAVKRDTDARRQLEQVLQMKPNPDYMPEYREAVEKAKKLIQTNF